MRGQLTLPDCFTKLHNCIFSIIGRTTLSQFEGLCFAIFKLNISPTVSYSDRELLSNFLQINSKSSTLVNFCEMKIEFQFGAINSMIRRKIYNLQALRVSCQSNKLAIHRNLLQSIFARISPRIVYRSDPH